MSNKGYILRGDAESQKFVMQANLNLIGLLDHVVFTYMIEPTDDPYEEFECRERKDEYYQRMVDLDRVKEICKYIRKAILSSATDINSIALFPTTILLAANIEKSELKESKEYDMTEFYRDMDSLLIIDGQHRLYSLKTLYEQVKNGDNDEDFAIKKYLENFTINCTIFINFDLWEQAKVFADVNFNQKKVSKSLYYSIYGMHMPVGMDDLKYSSIYIAHQLVRYVNTYSKSPLCGCIKMLGTGEGYVSQAFFVDALIRNFQPRGIWYLDPERNVSEDNYYYMAAELIDFWSIIKEKLGSMWPSIDKEQTSLLLKTTGVGSLLWLMAYIHKTKLSADLIRLMKSDYDAASDQYCMIVSALIEKIVPKSTGLFSVNGMFGGSGGKGQEGKLRKELQRLVDA